MKKLLSFVSILVTCSLLIMAFPQRAAAQDDDDPPGRVGRVSYMQGSISFRPAGEDDWVGAIPNRPITTGDMLWADANSRAEVRIGSATVRMDSTTGFSFLNLDDRTAQIQLSEGTLSVRVLRLEDGEVFEVDTPNEAFSILRPGLYRFEADPDGSSTSVTVRSGEGEATGGGQTFAVHPGQVATFTGTDSLYADIVSVNGADEFDNWSEARSRRFDESRSAHYVSPDVVGYEDLDDNGTWSADAEYGNVWTPRVAAGWAPYHDGHWVWIAPWGWTWVDDAPWGYAPFHYGRWVALRGRWCWVPGPVAVRAVYAPALVAFIGGSGFGVSISVGGGGGGNVGWFPLGPREVYVPAYHVSERYVNRVNVSNTVVSNTTITNVYNTQVTNINNTTNITNVTKIVYVNKTVPGAVTAVPQHAFTSAQPVAKAAVVVNAQQIAAAPVNVRTVATPTRNSVLGASAPTANRVAQPPAAIASRSVVAKAAPPAPPVSFARQQQALQAHPGQPLGRQELQGLRPANTPAAQPVVRQAPPGKPATPNMNRPFNQQQNGAKAGQPAVAQPQPAQQPNAQPARGGQPAVTQPNAQPNARPTPPTQPTPPARENPARPTPPNTQPTPATPKPNDQAPARPAQPNTQPQPPARPNTPPARPNDQPNQRPTQPNTQPQPPARPNTPLARPNDQPNQRPGQPNTQPQPPARPNTPPARPNDQPNQRPAQPAHPDHPPAQQPKPQPQPQPGQQPAHPNRPPNAQDKPKPKPDQKPDDKPKKPEDKTPQPQG